MATRFKINKLSSEAKAAVNRAAEVSGMGKNAFLDYVEQNGKLPPYVEGQELQLGDKVVGQINQELGQYNQKEDFEKLTDPEADEAAMTEDELQARQEAFEGTSNKTTVTEGRSRGDFAQELKNKLISDLQKNGYAQAASVIAQSNIGAEATSKMANGEPIGQWLAERMTQLVNAQFLGAIENENFNTLKAIASNTEAEFAQKLPGLQSTQTTAPDNSEDIKRIQDQIAAMQAQRATEAEIEAFLVAQPEELRASREEFLSGQEGYALDEFEEYVPRALGGLNARGMLFSGELGDELTSKALNLSGTLDFQRADLEAADNDFYFQAAYRNQIRKSLGASEDVRAAIESERQKVLGERENKFRSSQSDLDRNLDEQLKRDDAERSLKLRESSLKTQRDAEEKQRRANTLNTIIGAATTVGGAYIGAKASGAGSGGKNDTSAAPSLPKEEVG